MDNIVGPNLPFVTRGQPVILEAFVDSTGRYFVEIERVQDEIVSHVHYVDIDDIVRQAEEGLRAWLDLQLPDERPFAS